MTFKINYVKGSNHGAITDNGNGENKEYLACTTVTSKWFKSLKTAERFMEKNEYVRIENAD